jgi:hypothetical protein
MTRAKGFGVGGVRGATTKARASYRSPALRTESENQPDRLAGGNASEGSSVSTTGKPDEFLDPSGPLRLVPKVSSRRCDHHPWGLLRLLPGVRERCVGATGVCLVNGCQRAPR